MTTVVLGAQWGDEGKGKLTDILCAKASLCARTQGGNNAGHFFKELDDLHKKGLNTDGRIFLSDRAHIVFDLHLLVDGLQETELTEAAGEEQSSSRQVEVAKKKSGGAIGTTRKGIGPAYSDKHARSGVRVHHIFNKDGLDSRLRALAKGARQRYGHTLEDYDVEEEVARFDVSQRAEPVKGYWTYREKLQSFVVDAVPLIQDAQLKNTNILVEGANALMLDIDHGTYPYVTSSSTGIGGVFTGLGISPFGIKEIIGCAKSYCTRVGGGPFPSEQLNEDGDKLQSIGREFGVTTGRRRRCGWLDLVVLKYSCAINHYTSLNLTKLDVLDTFPTIKVAVAYKDTRSGSVMESFPADLDALDSDRCEVVYEELKGWERSIAGTKTYDSLPEEAKAYVEFIEKKVGVHVKYIGTGVEREAMIER
ncbi:MAG: hypothetical protein Q9208_000743 [Pyrenodesmia sp. 3 TL-2023]